MVCMTLNYDAWNHDGLNLPFSASWFELRVKFFKLQILSLLLPLRADVLTSTILCDFVNKKSAVWTFWLWHWLENSKISAESSVKHVVCFPSIFQLETRWKTQNNFTTFPVWGEKLKRKLKRGKKASKISPFFSVKNLWKTNDIFHCAGKIGSVNQCEFKLWWTEWQVQTIRV
jgi:hypothetical protein